MLGIHSRSTNLLHNCTVALLAQLVPSAIRSMCKSFRAPPPLMLLLVPYNLVYYNYMYVYIEVFKLRYKNYVVALML